jgi:hypothetical protein
VRREPLLLQRRPHNAELKGGGTNEILNWDGQTVLFNDLLCFTEREISMKVIGLGSDNNLICEISHQELEKFFNCYYKDSDPMRKSIRELKAGSALNLGQGYDHLSEIRSAFKQMQDFIKANENVIKGISSGLLLMTEVKFENSSSDTQITPQVI